MRQLAGVRLALGSVGAVVLLVGTSACVAELVVPDEAQILCDTDLDCPGSWLCRGGQCVIPGDSVPAVAVEPLGRVPTSPLTFRFRLFDADEEATRLYVHFATGNEWAAAQIVAARGALGAPVGVVDRGGVAELATSATGEAYEVEWDFTADLGPGAQTVRLRLVPSNSKDGQAVELGPLVLGNDAPTVGSANLETPSAPLASPNEERGSLIFSYAVRDTSSDLATVEDGLPGGPSVEFTADGGATWRPATVSFGQLVDLPTSPSGVVHRLMWQSDAVDDLPGFSGNVRLRMCAADTALGVPHETLDFPVDNGDKPTIVWVRTLDDDLDGSLDHLALNFNRGVRDTSLDVGRGAPVASAVTLGATLAQPSSAGDVADDSTVYLPLVPPFPDTAATGSLSAAEGLFTAVSNANPSAPIVAIQIRDTAPPAPLGATSADLDADGFLDTMTVVFSEDIDPTTFSSSGFSVTGGVVLGASLSSSREVTVSLTTTSLDTGATPAVRFDQSVGFFTDLLPPSGTPNRARGFTAVPADGAAPVLLDAVGRDVDADGHLDQVDCTYSEAVAGVGGTFDGTAHTLSSIPYGGTQGAAGSETQATARLVVVPIEGAGFGTAVVGLSVAVGPGELVDGANNPNVAVPSLAVRDGAAPRLASMTTGDVDGDGRLDRLTLTFSEAVDIEDGNAVDGLPGYVVSDPELPLAIDFAIAAEDYALLPWHAPGSNTLVLRLVEGSAPDTAALPRLDAVAAGVARDAAGNLQPFGDAFSAWAAGDGAADGAGPVVVGAVYDAGVSPSVADDFLTLTLSEPVDDSSIVGALAASSFELPEIGAFGAAAIVTTGATVDDAVLVVSMGSGAVAPVVGVDTVRLASGSGLEDLHGVGASAGNVAVLLVDSGSPVLQSAASRDLDRDGLVDHLALTFSQGVADTSYNPSAILIGSFNAPLAALASPAGDVVNDNVIYVPISEGTVPDTGVTGTLDLAAGCVEAHADADPNLAAGGFAVLDEAPPVPFTARTGDTDADGRIDELVVTLSENVTGSAGVGDWLVAGTLPAGVSQSGREVTLTMTEGGSPDTGALPTLAYAAVGATPLRDIVDLGIPTASYSTQDGAAPRPVSTTLRDTEPDGRLDAVDVVFSEPMEDAAFSSGGFSLGGAALGGFATLSTANDNTVRLLLLGSSFDGTVVGALQLLYTPGAARDRAPLSNLLGAVDGAAVSEADGAGPMPVGVAVLSDLDQNGEDAGDVLEIRFSEGLVLGGGLLASHFVFVAGDAAGSGATVSLGTSGDSVRITLGSGAVVGQVRFAPGGEGAPSSINLGGAVPAGALRDAANNTAVPAPNALDVTAGFADAGLSLGAWTSRGAHLADINMDGALDLALATSVGGKVYAQNGAFTFAGSPVTLGGASDDARALTSADLNWDGATDLVMVTSSGRPNTVFLSDGVGVPPVFTNTRALGTSDAYDVAVADLNKDGDLDVVLAIGGSGADEVWSNGGGPTYNFSSTTLADSSDGRGLALADFDRDGDPDLVVVNAGSAADRLWHNNGSGVFSTSTSLADSADGRDVAVADLDRDGDLDLAIANNGTSRIFWNQGGIQGGSVGVFAAGQALAVGDASGVAVVDDDLDGDLDLVLSTVGVGWSVWRNDDAVFTDSRRVFGVDGRGAVVADVDEDGDGDVLVALGGGGAAVWRGSASQLLGAAAFPSDPSFVEGPASLAAVVRYAVADLNHDGWEDVIAATDGSNTKNPVLWGAAAGWFYSDDVAGESGAGTYGVACADFDHDGDTDVFIPDSPSGNDTLFANAAGVLSSGATLSTTPLSYRADAGDIGRNGTVDLLDTLAQTASVAARVWINASATTFNFSTFMTIAGDPTPYPLRGGALADFDRNGQLDVVLGFGSRGSAPTTISPQLWPYDGSGPTFGPSVNIGAAVALAEIVALDFNRDAAMDVALGLSGEVRIHQNNGSGVFSAGPTVTVTGAAYAVASGDLDLDGRLDLVIASSTAGESGAWRYNGASYTLISKFASIGGSVGSSAVVLVDGDHDGDLDILIDDGADGTRYLINQLR